MSDKSLFVPPQAALNVVGLAKADIADDESIYRLIDAKDAEIRRSDAQISVLIYILHMRGAEEASLVKRTGYGSSTVYAKIAEGMAIVRTGNVDRATSAVRTGRLSLSMVDGVTKGGKSQADKLSELEALALGQHIKSTFVQEADGSAPQVENLPRLVETLAAAATNDSVPVVMSELIDYLPTVTESLGLKRKQRNTTPDPQGPWGLEYHFTQALADVKALEKAWDGIPYTLTEQDYAALLALCSHIGMDLSAPLFVDAE